MKQAQKGLAVFVLAIAAAVAQAETGVTPTTIVIGQSAAFSGPAQALGNDMRAGALAYFQAVNAAGGVNGRKIELRSLDDGYEPDRAAANTKKLIDDGVFLLFGYVGTPTSNAAKPIFTAARVPFVGPFTGAESLRNPVNRYIFNVRASYFDETEKIVNQLVGQTLDRIAVFYQNDDYGKAGLAGVERAMQKRNLKIVSTGTVERNTVDVAAAVTAIGKSDPQAVGRLQPAIHERILRRQQGAGSGSRPRGPRRGHHAGRAVSMERRHAGRQGVSAALHRVDEER
jgi:ABC-type branched-subunit amino acid transport system substrate-binding protein